MPDFQPLKLHTQDQIRDELCIILSDDFVLSLGGFALLSAAHNPVVSGGKTTIEDWENAMIACRREKMGVRKFLEAFNREAAAASRAFAMLQCGEEEKDEKTREMSPEWLVDLATSAASEAQGMTIKDVFWNISLVTVAHLVAAAMRKAGKKITRPEDYSDVFKKLENMK